MVTFLDDLSEFCGRLAAWLFFITGFVLVYEVIARYVFLSPTIWSEEMARFAQVWASCLASAWVLKHRHLIAIDVGVRKLGPSARKGAEIFSLLVIAVFSAVAVFKGVSIFLDSMALGRKSATMLEVPLWFSEISVPIGFGVLLLQCFAEAVKVLTGKVAAGMAEDAGRGAQ